MFKTEAGIISAFRSLPLRKRPDRGTGGTTVEFIKLQEAKDVLIEALNQPPTKKCRPQAQVQGKMRGSAGRWSV